MNVVFEDEALRELYEYGTTKDRKYVRYSRDKRFVTKLANKIRQILAAKTYDELFKLSSLHYERLKHDYSKLSSFRVGNEYVERVICREHANYIELIIIKLDDTHYGNRK